LAFISGFTACVDGSRVGGLWWGVGSGDGENNERTNIGEIPHNNTTLDSKNGTFVFGFIGCEVLY
jgi:hypothetical protein